MLVYDNNKVTNNRYKLFKENTVSAESYVNTMYVKQIILVDVWMQ